MDLRPTIIIVSLLATLILMGVMAGGYWLYRTRHRSEVSGSVLEEGDMPVRKFTIRQGRVVPDSLKASGIADRARTWTDRPSWFLGESRNLNARSRGQGQPSTSPPTWPISKYNPMSQHNPLSKQVEYPVRKHNPQKVRESGGASMRSTNRLKVEGKTPSAGVPQASAVVDNKGRRVGGGNSSSSSTAQVRRLARSLERAYDVPSPHTRSKVNISTPKIVITQDVFANHQHHRRSKEKPVANTSKDRVNGRSMRSAAVAGTKRKDPPPTKSTSSTLQIPIKPPNEDAPQRKGKNGLTSANGTPLASSDTLPTRSPNTSSTRRPLPNFPQPPTAHSATCHSGTSRTPRPSRPLARSQITARRKRHPTHRPAKPAATDTGPAPASASSAPQPTPPSNGAAIESSPNHSRASSKSLATFASSDFSDAYTLGRALPVAIVPASMSSTRPHRMMGREKPLPRLPVADDLVAEPGGPAHIGKNGKSNRGVQGGERGAGPTMRSAIEG